MTPVSFTMIQSVTATASTMKMMRRTARVCGQAALVSRLRRSLRYFFGLLDLARLDS